ncbi:MAG: hypothetical protein KGZ87_08480 [Bacteroidetes bacterium]|jgi:hypothetical protein|nr:hypothetical protein [Bacteroidota bacterium]
MFGNFFKPRTHYEFDYKPRYYDERKERLENLKKKYEDQSELDDASLKIRLTKNNLKSDWIRAKKSTADRNTSLRLAIIITILVGLIAYIFQIHTLF